VGTAVVVFIQWLFPVIKPCARKFWEKSYKISSNSKKGEKGEGGGGGLLFF
jgi:hypothetical protein